MPNQVVSRALTRPVGRIEWDLDNDVACRSSSSTKAFTCEQVGHMRMTFEGFTLAAHITDTIDVIGERPSEDGGRLFNVAGRRAFVPASVSPCPSRHRSMVLIEGPPALPMPDVHPHAIQGVVVSLAAMWRLPVLHTSGPEDSLRVVQFLASQAGDHHQPVLRRYARKPKRLASRRIFMLQGLPGVGPALATRLLNQLGSVERVVSADVETLMQIRGVGLKKAARIRELVG